MADILIGAADLYSWADVRPWVVSARRSGFAGDIYLICYRVAEDMVEAEKYGVELYRVEHTPYSTPIQHSQQGSPTQAHNLRFYHAWELLTRLGVSHDDHVIMTDVRDVIFQRNPSPWLDENLREYDDMVAASECIHFKHEPWNKDNLIKGFGQISYDLFGADEWVAFNVGTLAGRGHFMTGLFNTIYRMTEGRYYPSDQSSFNVLLRTSLSYFAPTPYYAWAAQLGTTRDPTKSYLWEHCYFRPDITPEGIVQVINTPFVIVHQWDRVPELKAVIPERYKE